MSSNDKHAISKAKKALRSKSLSTESGSGFGDVRYFLLFLLPSVHSGSAAEQSLAQLTAMRVAQLIAGAGSFAAAQFKR
jgi:hypothetical protein